MLSLQSAHEAAHDSSSPYHDNNHGIYETIQTATMFCPTPTHVINALPDAVLCFLCHAFQTWQRCSKWWMRRVKKCARVARESDKECRELCCQDASPAEPKIHNVQLLSIMLRRYWLLDTGQPWGSIRKDNWFIPVNEIWHLLLRWCVTAELPWWEKWFGSWHI